MRAVLHEGRRHAEGIVAHGRAFDRHVSNDPAGASCHDDHFGCDIWCYPPKGSDTASSGETGDESTANTGETGETGDTGNTGNTGDTNDPGDTGGGEQPEGAGDDDGLE